MKYRAFAGSLFLLAHLAGAQSGQSQSPLPSSPAGQVMGTFLSAFNSADKNQLNEYTRRYGGIGSANELLGFSGSTGGFTVVSIKSSVPDQLKVLLRGRSDGVLSFADLKLETGNPDKVERFTIRALPPTAPFDDSPLTSTTRRETLHEVEADLLSDYIDPEAARLMVKKLQAKLQSGAYDAISDGDQFAATLTTDLASIIHDGHLFIAYSPAVSPEGNAAAVPGPAEIAMYRGTQKRDNCSFSEVRVLPRNVGYLKFDEFADPEQCGPTVVSAMGFLAHVDALIVDLRDNHGGQPAMVQLILSYFFEEKTHLNDIYFRPDNATQQFWTLPYVPGTRLPATPLYVLTSNRTFSGAEEFVNDLKAQKRAVIVGGKNKRRSPPARRPAGGRSFRDWHSDRSTHQPHHSWRLGSYGYRARR